MTESSGFDARIPRAGTHAEKIEALPRLFGREALLPLWVADMDFAAPAAITQALQARAAHPIYGYTEVPDDLRAAIFTWYARRFHWQIAPSTHLFCPGVMPSIHATLMALTQPGDAVLVQTPVYPPLLSAVTDTGRKLVTVPLVENELHYQMDFASIEAHARAGLKAIVLCSPHNPVARVWTAAELTQLLDIANRYALWVISDEIHADLVYPEHTHTPLATLPGSARVVTAISASKTFNIPGLALSSLVVADDVARQQIEAVLKTWHVSVANPFSLAANLAGYSAGADWLTDLLQYLHASRDMVCTELAARCPEIRVTPAQGTTLLWLDCRAMQLSPRALSQWFVDAAGLALNAGERFGPGGAGFMRLNLASPRSVLCQAIDQLEAALQHWRQSAPMP